MEKENNINEKTVEKDEQFNIGAELKDNKKQLKEVKNYASHR